MYEAKQCKEPIARTLSNSRKIRRTIGFDKQNNNIHFIQKYATNNNLHSRKIIQLLAIGKIPSILKRSKIDDNYFWSVGWGALEVMANRQNQTVEQYCNNLSEEQLIELIKKLQSEFEEENTSFNTTKVELLESKKYLNMNVVAGTNILVDKYIDKNDKNLANFINLYKLGNMVWYRGLSITHFSYNTFYGTGLLFSEGVEDIPMFTMGNNNKTRWLPGVWNDELPAAIAHQIYTQDTGLQWYWKENIMLPIGVVVAFDIKPTMPIAYLNDSEQVIRGPVRAKLHKIIYSSSGSDHEIKKQNLPMPLKFGLKKEELKLKNWVEKNRLSVPAVPDPADLQSAVHEHQDLQSEKE